MTSPLPDSPVSTHASRALETPSLIAPAAVPGSRWRIVVACLAGVVAVGAFYGSWYLTGEAALHELPVAPPDFLPGDGWGMGALALLVLVAAPMTIACLTATLGHPAAAPAATLAGGLLVGWIVVQMLLIGFVSVLQPLLLVVGLVVLALGMVGYHPLR